MAEKEVKKGYTGFSNELVNDPIIKNSKAWTLFSYCLFKAYFDDKYGEAGTFTTTQIEMRKNLNCMGNVDGVIECPQRILEIIRG